MSTAMARKWFAAQATIISKLMPWRSRKPFTMGRGIDYENRIDGRASISSLSNGERIKGYGIGH